jgi:hypothetical protein
MNNTISNRYVWVSHFEQKRRMKVTNNIIEIFISS